MLHRGNVLAKTRTLSAASNYCIEVPINYISQHTSRWVYPCCKKHSFQIYFYLYLTVTLEALFESSRDHQEQMLVSSPEIEPVTFSL